MVEVTIQLVGGKRLTRKLKTFGRVLPQQIRKGFVRAGGIFLKSIRQKISGEGYSRNPGRGVPYPGIKSGEMFRTLFVEVKDTTSGPSLRVGPNVEYAVFQEFGTKHIPARPFIDPTLEGELDKAMDAIQQEIAKPLR